MDTVEPHSFQIVQDSPDDESSGSDDEPKNNKVMTVMATSNPQPIASSSPTRGVHFPDDPSEKSSSSSDEDSQPRRNLQNITQQPKPTAIKTVLTQDHTTAPKMNDSENQVGLSGPNRQKRPESFPEAPVHAAPGVAANRAPGGARSPDSPPTSGTFPSSVVHTPSSMKGNWKEHPPTAEGATLKKVTLLDEDKRVKRSLSATNGDFVEKM